MYSEAKTPTVVDIIEQVIANIKEFKNAVSIILSLKSSKNQLNVKPLKTVLDFVTLKAKTIIIIIGIYKNNNTKIKQNLDNILLVIY